MRALRPIIDKQKYSRVIFLTIWQCFANSLFDELVNIIKPIREYYNDSNVIIEAILQHKIQYVDGKFIGKFNAKISKELMDLGAKFDKRKSAFVIDKAKLPVNINHAIAVASLTTATMYKQVIQFLNSFDSTKFIANLNEELNVPLDEILEDLDEQTIATLENSIKIKVNFTPTEREQLIAKYVDNLQLPIKGFVEEQVNRLRELVEKSILEGLGDKNLIDTIMREFNVSRNKAVFWARQETGLFVSNYRQIVYKRANVTKYKWSTSHDERVRQMHKDLDGKIFEFDNPPITNEKGDRNNPGEDWQCRCQPIPII